MISKWKIQVLNPSGEVQGDLSGLARNRSFVITRNRPEQIILVFDLDKIEHYARDSKTNVGDLLKEGVNEIHIWRGNEKVVSGQINYSRATIQSDKRIHEVRAIGWLGLLLGDGGRNTRSVQTFSATDQGAILWALIDHTQTQTNGNIGITEGTIEATVDRDRTYPIDKNIGDAIIEMTEVINGLDVEITPDKVFNVYKRIGEDRSYLIFEHPGGIKGLALEPFSVAAGEALEHHVFVAGLHPRGETGVLGDDVDRLAVAGQFFGGVGGAEVVAPDEHPAAAFNRRLFSLVVVLALLQLAAEHVGKGADQRQVDAGDFRPGNPPAGGQNHRVEVS